MTENEAIQRHIAECKRRINTIRNYMKDSKNIETCNANIHILEAGIQALEEIQEYRAIGTTEECRAAVERMKPRKPINVGAEGIRYTDSYRCPNCKGNFSATGIANHCYHCGQAIDWGGDNA